MEENESVYEFDSFQIVGIFCVIGGDLNKCDGIDHVMDVVIWNICS